MTNQAEEIVTTVGQAFEVAFQRFKDAKKAKEDFRALKARVSLLTTHTLSHIQPTHIHMLL